MQRLISLIAKSGYSSESEYTASLLRRVRHNEANGGLFLRLSANANR